MQNSIAYLKQHQDRYLNELIDLLKIPSVSADSKHKSDVLYAANWVKNAMDKIGLEKADIYPTKGHPIVYGEKTIDENLPTVLVYGHYDVQPPDPLDLWHAGPFDPQIKDGKIIARGAADDKGQFYMHFAALEAMIHCGDLPCNVKVLIEGEEEVGSDHLNAFVLEHKERLKCDAVLISDTSLLNENTPSITTGVKGLAYLEVEVTGPNKDLHSGTYGGAVANPINALCKMIASLQDEAGKITIPDFYKNVLDLSKEERDEIARAPFDVEKYKIDLGIDDVFGESGYSTLERTGIRPTLDVNGIWGGYTGEGAKTVLPSKAFAKISMRLVPNQTCDEISALFQKHFTSIAPVGTKVKVTPHHGGNPATTDIFSKAYEAASRAMEEHYGKKPIPVKAGGSIPIVSFFKEVMDVEVVLMGFGLDEDAIHSPNESYRIQNFNDGTQCIPWFYHYFNKG